MQPLLSDKGAHAQVRADCAIDSAKVCMLPPGEHVEAFEVRLDEETVRPVLCTALLNLAAKRILNPILQQGLSRVRLARGWASETMGNGAVALQELAEPAKEPVIKRFCVMQNAQVRGVEQTTDRRLGCSEPF